MEGNEHPHLTPLQRKVLHLPTRNRIYETIWDQPGIHLRLLSRDLDLAMGTLEHHLRVMERYGLLTSQLEGRRRFFFPSGHPLSDDSAFFHLLRSRQPRRILAELLDAEEMDHATLVERLPFSASTVSYHTKRLAGMGVLERYSVGRGTWYKLRDEDHARELVRACGIGRAASEEAGSASRSLAAQTSTVVPVPGR